MISMRKLIFNFLNNKKEAEKEEPVITNEDGKTVRYPKKKKKLKQKDVFEGITTDK